MGREIAARFTTAAGSMAILLLLTFLMLRATGDPVLFLVPPGSTIEQMEFARSELGLDEGLLQQGWAYITQLARGNLGVSFFTRGPVTDLILERLPNTLRLAGASSLLIVLFGLPLGLYSAYRRGSRFDQAVRGYAALGQSVPEFWLGFLLILVFAINLNWVPPGGQAAGISSYLLPAMTLSWAATAGFTRLLRSSMIEELNSDYIRFARVKGIGEQIVLWKHGLRNGALTTMTFMGVLIASLVAGSVLVETIFVWPGVGRLMVESVERRDFNVVQGVVLFYAAVYIGMSFLVDVLYNVLNPRLRRAMSGSRS